jgi:mono/diheme cytochrome c family protein
MRGRTFVALSASAVALVALSLAAAPRHTPSPPGTRSELASGAATIPSRPTAIAAAPARAPQASAAAEGTSDAAFLKQYCVTCHSARAKSGGLTLEGLELADVAAHAETWEKVVRKVRTGMMPPSGAPRPGRPVLDAFAAAMEARLDRAAVPGANLATPALHRLNRTEYANAIRDLLSLEVDVTTLLPGDGASEGFDNLAEALSISPTLIQGYVSAAMKISRLAVGDRTLPPSQTTYPAPPQLVQSAHIDGLPLGTRGGMRVTHFFPLDAEYDFGTGGGGGRGGGAGLDITIDGERVTVANPRNIRIPVTAGPHVVGVALPDRQRGAGVDEIYSDFRTDAAFAPAGGVQALVITGPHNPTGPGDTPSRRRIFTCRPEAPAAGQPAAAAETACARQILSTLARRAYRGPVTAAEIDTLMTFYQQGRTGGDFETGIQQALARVLVGPRFLFRIEEQPARLAAGTVYRISDVELASRLSFFLWSSIPDDTLLDLAARNRLREPAVLREQVQRMLADPKSAAFIENFAGQWLYLRELANVQTEAKSFDDNLRHSFRRETELLFEAIVREDRSLIDLLDADYTFVDERLARHYGMPDVRGSHFRRVTLPPDSPRRGLLGHGSMLTVTSVATRTSPVSRGKWILENLFGAPPPQPPPGVETNLEEPADSKPTTLRQRLELHRSNPVCASCHNIMDPLGFSLENFDLVGAWREHDGPAPIDPTGRLADGTPLGGPADLRRALLSRSEAFMTTVTEKLLIYALGRPVHYYDMPQVRAIARRASADGHRFSAVLLGVVDSDPFQKRIK